jgi:hypothetical protein
MTWKWKLQLLVSLKGDIVREGGKETAMPGWIRSSMFRAAEAYRRLP